MIQKILLSIFSFVLGMIWQYAYERYQDMKDDIRKLKPLDR